MTGETDQAVRDGVRIPRSQLPCGRIGPDLQKRATSCPVSGLWLGCPKGIFDASLTIPSVNSTQETSDMDLERCVLARRLRASPTALVGRLRGNPQTDGYD